MAHYVFGSGPVFRRCERVTPYAFLAKILSEKYDVSSDAISLEATVTELGLDSLTVVELLFDVEDEFGIEIPEERATFETLAEAAALVDELVQAKGA
jgi:acyl carrier protein